MYTDTPNVKRDIDRECRQYSFERKRGLFNFSRHLRLGHLKVKLGQLDHVLYLQDSGRIDFLRKTRTLKLCTNQNERYCFVQSEFSILHVYIYMLQFHFSAVTKLYHIPSLWASGFIEVLCKAALETPSFWHFEQTLVKFYISHWRYEFQCEWNTL